MLWVIGTVGIVYLATAARLDQRGRRAPPDERFDAIVVLGCRVHSNGRASPSLARRARLGAELYHRGLAPRVVLTGGLGDHAPTEAAAAAVVARELGVPESAIVLEERSTSTEGNARETAHLLSASRVLIVTDAYHAFRAERVFRRHFDRVAAAGTVAPDRATRARGALREVIAVTAYALLGRL